MSDLQNDPNLGRSVVPEYDPRVQWVAVAAILLLCGALIVGLFWSGSETQTAMNFPAAETTGSASPIPVLPPKDR
jgi:hypothetical protein